MYKKLEHMMNDDAKNQMGLNIGITEPKEGCGSLQSKEDKKPETKIQEAG